MPNPTTWYPDEIQFLRNNFYSMTNAQMLDHINKYRSDKLILSSLRHQCYRLGLKRGIQIRWSQEDIAYLIKHYPHCGDTELAIRFNKRKKTFRIINGKRVYRRFSKKHIEKKRKLLGLIRDTANIDRIRKRNIEIGLSVGTFTSTDNLWSRGLKTAIKEGETSIQKNNKFYRKMIKINGFLIPFGRWYYHNYIKALDKTEYVKFKDFDQTNCVPENMYISKEKNISQSERQSGITLLDAREKALLKDLGRCTTRPQESEVMKELSRVRKLKKHFAASRCYLVNNSVAKSIEWEIEQPASLLGQLSL